MGGLDITPSMIAADGVAKDDLVGIPAQLIAPVAQVARMQTRPLPDPTVMLIR